MANKHKKPRRSHTVIQQRFQDTLRAADHAIDQERFVDALRLVLPLASSAQGDPQLLLRLFQCYHGLGQLSEATALLERITYLCPDEAGTLALLVRLRAAQGQPALQVHDARRYLERFAEHAEAGEVAGLLQSGEAYLRKEAEVLRAPEPGPGEGGEPVVLGGPRFEVLLLWERTEAQVHRGEVEGALEPLRFVCQELPRLWSAQELLAMVLLRCGRCEEALAQAEQLLVEGATQGVSAALVRAHALRWLGRDEAAAAAAALRELPLPQLSSAVALAESLAMMGDEEGVSQVAKRARAQFGDPLPEGELAARLLHLEAASAYHRGIPRRAERLWRESLRMVPQQAEAARCLRSLQGPPGEMECHAVSFVAWLAEGQLTALFEASRSEAVEEGLRAVLQRDPVFARLLADAGLYGDPALRALVVLGSQLVDAPYLREAVKKLALGRYGRHIDRLRALVVATELGLVPQGPVPVWNGLAFVPVDLSAPPPTKAAQDEPTRP